MIMAAVDERNRLVEFFFHLFYAEYSQSVNINKILTASFSMYNRPPFYLSLF